jgi:hypothetical protein
MQVFVPGWLAQPSRTISLYQYLDVVFNDIGDEGCRYLSEAGWSNLQALDLRIIIIMYIATTSNRKDANICPKLIGTI